MSAASESERLALNRVQWTFSDAAPSIHKLVVKMEEVGLRDSLDPDGSQRAARNKL